MGSNVKLLLIGKRSLKNKIHRLIKVKGLSRQVKHMKNLTEYQLYSLYSIANVTVFPMLNISVPDLVILEAMTAGLSIISTNIWRPKHCEAWIKWLSSSIR